MTNPKSLRIAFLGLGKMGLPMAGCLAAAGYRVVGFDPFEAARTAFAKSGREIAQTSAEAAQDANVLSIMLHVGTSVAHALGGPDDLRRRVVSGGMVVALGSADPHAT